jgi:4-aminobutyrate aminotransferase
MRAGSPNSSSVALFIAEPIQGVGGFITPPQEYLQIIERIVRTHGGVFISDEVQTGWAGPAATGSALVWSGT